MDLRARMLAILQEEDKLQEIVQLVGEDVLPDDQRLIIEIARVLKVDLQQNAFHESDTYVPLKSSTKCLNVSNFL